MSEVYRTIDAEAFGEIEEKRSRFLAALRHVESREEAEAFYEEIRKKHYSARHNCTACVIGKAGDFLQSSDDGEPSGTAGRPMLDVLQGAGLTDVAAVVTRYFGGTLLGTGGLTRAYSSAVQEALKGARIIEKTLRKKLKITAAYDAIGKLQHMFAQRQIPVLESEYGERVILQVAVLPEEVENVKTAVADATAGQADLESLEQIWL